MKEAMEKLKALVYHGVEFHSKVGDQAVGDCPFCGKANRFYANIEKILWDCKVCGVKGNLAGFLAQISKQNEGSLTDAAVAMLSANRKLPRSAFTGWELGWNGVAYTIPVRDIAGTVVDIRTYRLGEKTRSTSGARLGLLGAEKLEKDRTSPVYICEGEWDAFALEWLMRKLEQSAVVLSVPGANVFKLEWVPWFEGRDVVALHDHDAAGDAGRKIVAARLGGIAKSVKAIDWPLNLPDGWDVRDLIYRTAIKEARPRAALRLLTGLILTPKIERREAESSSQEPQTGETAGVGPKGPKVPLRPHSHARVYEAYKKWMHLPDDQVLRVMFGAVFANKMQGDPIWLFLVAPPGGSKSELLSSLSNSPLVESTTALTPHSLVSGAALFNGHDPSLLPKLDGRILVIKDFTTILSMHYSSRDEIFGILRDAYDGRTEKTFGTGLKRTYISHFGIIAGVTPKIEEFGVVHQSLGERFLKYRINTGQKTMSEADRIRRALSNINHEKEMKSGLALVAEEVLAHPLPAKLPDIPPAIFEHIVSLAQTCAMMRGVVERDRFSGTVHYKPATEVGTRLAKQLAKLGIGIAIYMRRPTVDIEIYRVIRKVALDTAPDRVEEILRQIWRRTEDPNASLTTNDVSLATRLPVVTCFRVLQDLELLRVVNRVGTGNKYSWKLNERMLKLLIDGKVYERGS